MHVPGSARSSVLYSKANTTATATATPSTTNTTHGLYVLFQSSVVVYRVHTQGVVSRGSKLCSEVHIGPNNQQGGGG